MKSQCETVCILLVSAAALASISAHIDGVWTEMPPPSGGQDYRYRHSAISFRDTLYMFGGVQSDEPYYTNSLWKLPRATMQRERDANDSSDANDSTDGWRQICANCRSQPPFWMYNFTTLVLRESSGIAIVEHPERDTHSLFIFGGKRYDCPMGTDALTGNCVLTGMIWYYNDIWEIELANNNDSVISPWRERCTAPSACRMSNVANDFYNIWSVWLRRIFMHAFGELLYVFVDEVADPRPIFVFNTTEDSWAVIYSCEANLDANCPPSFYETGWRISATAQTNDSVVVYYGQGMDYPYHDHPERDPTANVGGGVAVYKFNVFNSTWYPVCVVDKTARRTTCGDLNPMLQIEHETRVTALDSTFFVFAGTMVRSDAHAVEYSNTLWALDVDAVDPPPQWRVVCRGTSYNAFVGASRDTAVGILANGTCASDFAEEYPGDPRYACDAAVYLADFPELAPQCETMPRERILPTFVDVDRPHVGDRVLLMQYGTVNTPEGASDLSQLRSLWMFGAEVSDPSPVPVPVPSLPPSTVTPTSPAVAVASPSDAAETNDGEPTGSQFATSTVIAIAIGSIIGSIICISIAVYMMHYVRTSKLADLDERLEKTEGDLQVLVHQDKVVDVVDDDSKAGKLGDDDSVVRLEEADDTNDMAIGLGDSSAGEESVVRLDEADDTNDMAIGLGDSDSSTDDDRAYHQEEADATNGMVVELGDFPVDDDRKYHMEEADVTNGMVVELGDLPADDDIVAHLEEAGVTNGMVVELGELPDDDDNVAHLEEANVTNGMVVELGDLSADDDNVAHLEEANVTNGMVVELGELPADDDNVAHLEEANVTNGMVVELGDLSADDDNVANLEEANVTNGMVVELGDLSADDGNVAHMEEVNATNGVVVELGDLSADDDNVAHLEEANVTNGVVVKLGDLSADDSIVVAHTRPRDDSEIAADLEDNPIVEGINRPHPKVGEAVAQLHLEREEGFKWLHPEKDDDLDSEYKSEGNRMNDVSVVGSDGDDVSHHDDEDASDSDDGEDASDSDDGGYEDYDTDYEDFRFMCACGQDFRRLKDLGDHQAKCRFGSSPDKVAPPPKVPIAEKGVDALRKEATGPRDVEAFAEEGKVVKPPPPAKDVVTNPES